VTVMEISKTKKRATVVALVFQASTIAVS